MESGFVTASGSAGQEEDVASPDTGKFCRADGDVTFTYNFVKPILFSGYLIQTGKGEDNDYNQPKAWTVRVNDMGEGGSDILLHEVTNEKERETLTDKEYHLTEEA